MQFYKKKEGINLNNEYIKMIEQIKSDQINNVCFECGSEEPQYISINNAVFICKECIINHLSFSQEISQIILNDMNSVLLYHVEEVLRRERRGCLHLRHGHAEAGIVQRTVEDDVIVLSYILRTVSDILLRIVLVRRCKARHDASDRPAPVLPAVRAHQYEPRADAVLACFKLDEALVRPRLSFPLATPGGADVKDIVLCNHNFLPFYFFTF